MKKADIIAGTLAFVLTAAFIGAIVMLSWRGIPASNEQLLTYMLGQLSGFVAAALGLYFARPVPVETPSGTRKDPIQTEIVNSPTDAVPVEEKETEK